MAILTRDDAPNLYYEEDWVEQPRAYVLLVHGFGDHCGRYERFAESLNAEEISVLRYDYRGHGRSGGKVGDFERFEDYLDDLRCLWERLRATARELPCFLLGHSNGGLVAFHAAAEGLENCAGLVLSSPFFGLKMGIPLWKRAALKILNRTAPGLRLSSELHPEWMSHDPDVVRSYGEDEFIGRVVSTRWFLKTKAAQERAVMLAPKLKIPTLFQIAGDDHVVNPRAAEQIYQLIEGVPRHWCEYPSLYHELWFEAEEGRRAVLGDLTSWLNAQLAEHASEED